MLGHHDDSSETHVRTSSGWSRKRRERPQCYFQTVFQQGFAWTHQTQVQVSLSVNFEIGRYLGLILETFDPFWPLGAVVSRRGGYFTWLNAIDFLFGLTILALIYKCWVKPTLFFIATLMLEQSFQQCEALSLRALHLRCSVLRRSPPRTM